MNTSVNLHVAAWRSGSVTHHKAEAFRSASAYEIEVHNTYWREPGDGIFHPQLCFIEMALTPRLVKASYSANADWADYRLMGDISFIPPDTPLFYRSVAGSQRSITCMFDPVKLAERWQISWQWPDFDLSRSLAIGNDLVRLSLRKICEEILSPGFAHSAQIEMSLMTVALELHKEMGAGDTKMDAAAGKLRQRDVELLKAMVLDYDGAGPEITELAAALGMAPRQLAAAYRAATGHTLRTMIAQMRIERAKADLHCRSQLIKQVAFNAGFQSSAAFSAAFRKATGQTPEEYRRRFSI